MSRRTRRTGFHVELLETRDLPSSLSVGLAAPATSTTTTTITDKNVQKFTFTGVTLVDSDSSTVENAVIEASLKMTNKSTVVVYDYYTADHATYLGQFEQVIPADEPLPTDLVNSNGDITVDTLEQYGIDQFPDRQVT